MLFVVFAPAVTMRLIAEERKSGTFELLLTMPVRDGEVVLGKFLAALGIVAAGLLCTLPYAISVSFLTARGGVRLGQYGRRLRRAALPRRQLPRPRPVGERAEPQPDRRLHHRPVAVLRLLLRRQVRGAAARIARRALQYLSVDYHFDNIARGVLDTRDLLFYLSLTGAGLFLTTHALARARR